MSYTTVPTANRIGYSQGWSNLLNSQAQLNHSIEQVSQLKNYLLLSEYFKSKHLHLLSADSCKNAHIKVLNVTFYKKIHCSHPKHSTPHDYCKLSKEGLAKVMWMNRTSDLFGMRRRRKSYRFIAKFLNLAKRSRIKSKRPVRRYWIRYNRRILVKRAKRAHKALNKRHKLPLPPHKIMSTSTKRAQHNQKKVLLPSKLNRRLVRNWITLQRWKWDNTACYTPPVTPYVLRGVKPTPTRIPKKFRFHSLIRRKTKRSRNRYKKTYIHNTKQILIHRRIVVGRQKFHRLRYLLEHYSYKWLGTPQIIKLQPPFRLFDRKTIYTGEHKWYAVRTFYRQDYFKQFLYALKVGQHHLNPQLIAELIADELINTRKRHRQFARNIAVMLADFRPSYIKGFKLRLTGKLDGKSESEGEWFRSRKSPEVPTQQFNKRFAYALAASRTYTGLFGVKIWIHY